MRKRKTFAVVFKDPFGVIEKRFFNAIGEEGSRKVLSHAERLLKKEFKQLPVILEVKELPQ